MHTNIKYKDVNFTMCIPPVELHTDYPGGNVQTYIMNKNVWAEDETAILVTILNMSKGVVIDVGANTGYFSFIALSKNCPVISFEPNTVHTPYFMETLKLNNFGADISHHELFVSSSSNEVMFDGWTSYKGICDVSKTYSVKTVSLDSVCSECLFLKVDVEGFEPDVFKSAKNLLSNAKVPYIMFEITYIISDKLDTEQVNMLYSLEEYGYDLYQIDSGYLYNIDNIQSKIKKWEDDYFNYHKKYNPSLLTAGSNVIAIHKSANNPFQNIRGTKNYKIM
jgi:FkbM family methyltransferase